MKQLLLILAGCATLSVHAEPFYAKSKQLQPLQYEMSFSVMEMQIAKVRANNKGTGVLKRMIANSYYAEGQKIDSNRYYFSEGRGTTNGAPKTYYSSYQISSYNQIKDILCDSGTNWHDYTGGLEWINTDRYTYNPQNKVTSTEVSGPYFSWRYEGVYNSSSKLEKINRLDTFGGTALQLKNTIYIEYDAQGKRIKDSTILTASNTVVSRSFYAYDVSGNLTDFSSFSFRNGTWELTMRNTFTYDVQNRLLTEAREGDYGSGFMKYSKDSFAYSGNNIEPNFHGTFFWDNNNALWLPYERFVYTFGSNGFHDAYTIYSYNNSGNWDTVEHDLYIYDANNLLIGSNGYRYIGNGQFSSTPYDQNTLYFEDYFPASVLNTAENNIDVQLFPNPASDMLFVKADENVASVKILSMNGAVMMQKDCSDKQASLDISYLAPGSYLVVLTAADGSMLAHDKFVKQ